MFERKLIFLFSLLLTINLYGASQEFALQTGYETDYAKALKKAKKQNKPIMMVISSKTCPWCRKFERQTLKKTEINQIVSKDFIPLALTRDVDKYPEHFDAKVIPTVFFIDQKNEKAFEKSFGYKNKKEYKKVLAKSLEKYQELK